MNFDELIRKRCSTRLFSKKEIEEEKLNKILEAGRVAPTAKNSQPFKIYVVRSKEGIDKIDKATKCRYGAPVVLLVCGDKDKAYTKDDFSTYVMDTSIVTTHMMLEATNIGIDNIWIELFNPNTLKEEFELPENLVPVVLMPIGYKAKLCPPSPMHSFRKKISDLVEYK